MNLEWNLYNKLSVIIQKKANFDQRQTFKKMFIEVREMIHKLVRSCADNVKVVIHMNEILDDPIIVTAGKGENILLVTIHSETGVDHKWTKETWTKVFWEWLGER